MYPIVITPTGRKLLAPVVEVDGRSVILRASHSCLAHTWSIAARGSPPRARPVPSRPVPRTTIRRPRVFPLWRRGADLASATAPWLRWR